MKRKYHIHIQGKTGLWIFPVKADPASVAEWRADGIEVGECGGTIPMWVVQMGLIRPWVAMQQAWNSTRLW